MFDTASSAQNVVVLSITAYPLDMCTENALVVYKKLYIIFLKVTDYVAFDI